MIYCPSIELGILLIPKCGATWLIQTVKAMGIGQAVQGQARHGGVCKHHGLPEHYGPCRGVKLAAFVRHPESWYRSWWAYNWRMRRRIGKRGDLATSDDWHPGRSIVKHMQSNFKHTMVQLMRHEPAIVTRRYEWYCGPEGAERVDYIGRIENAHKDLTTILRDCGYRGDVPDIGKANQSGSDKVEWDEDVLSRMLALERPAIRRFYEGDHKVVVDR